MTTKMTTLALATTLSALTMAQAPAYKVANLGSLNGQSEAFAINQNGVAVGWSFTTSGTRQAVIFNTNNTITPLATPFGKNSIALAIDKAGRIVGKVDKQGALWVSNAGYTSLGTLGGQESVASGINDNGLIAMSAQDSQAHWRPASYLITGGTATSLPTLGGVQGAAAVCSNGNIAGWSDLANGLTHATLWANGNTFDYGTLGGPTSQFMGVSDQGMAVGWSTLSDKQSTPTNKGNIYRAVKMGTNQKLSSLGEPYMARPYPTTFAGGYKGFTWKYWDRGNMVSASVVGIDCKANAAQGNTIVGTAMLYTLERGLVSRAVAWINGAFYDLTNVAHASGWTFLNAWGVNKNGQIVGQGFAPNGGMMAFRLDPDLGNGTGLKFARFQVVTSSGGTPILGQANIPTGIPTVTLYVRKSDGMIATSLAGPYNNVSLLTAVLTDPFKTFTKVKLSIDERGAPVSPNGVANWNNVCNGLQNSYSNFLTGTDGMLRATWAGTNMRDVLNAFPKDSELDSRWKFSVNGNLWLSLRLKLRKGAGY